MIDIARIYSDFSSEIVFEDGSIMVLPQSITPILLKRKKEKKKSQKEKAIDDISKEKSMVEILPSKVIQSIECMSSSVLPIFQTAIAFLNLYLPHYSFVYFRSLLDRKVLAHRRRFESDLFLFDSQYIIAVGRDGSIQFGSKNGLAALTLHPDGVHIQLKYFSLVYHRENEEDEIFENKEKESYLYTWELKFYTIYQLKAMGYLTFPISVLEEVRKILKENTDISEEELKPFLECSENYGKKFLFKFPPNICFLSEKSQSDREQTINREHESKSLFFEYKRAKDSISKIYINENEESIENEFDEVFTEICLGKESINIFHSTKWKSVVYYEEVDAVWTKRIYPRNVYNIVHADVHNKIQLLHSFLKRNNPIKSHRSNAEIRRILNSGRRECELTNQHGEFKCFKNGTIHIAFKEDGAILEEKEGLIRILSKSGVEETYDVEKSVSSIPKKYLNEYLGWKKWVEMDEEEMVSEVEKTERIDELIEMSRKRIKETQKIINRNEINRIISEKIQRE